MSERMRLVARLEEGESVDDVSREFGVTRKTAYKFWARFKELGPAGLYDVSRAPKHVPHRAPEELLDLVAAARQQHPKWGGKKLKHVLELKHPGVQFPAASTITCWLKKRGLVSARPRRHRTPTPSETHLTQPMGPNDVWATDFKGQFRLGNRQYCYPLTITDVKTRFLVACEALEGTEAAPAWCVFENVFREYGLPLVIRSDNGGPFAASRGLAGLTSLSAKWVRLGIRHERIQPGEPQQNGQHERMHRTLKAETTRPSGQTLLQQQERFDSFIAEFNNERPHEGIEMLRPADLYRRSDREYRGLPELDYPLHDEVRTVVVPGVVKLKQDAIYLTRALVGEQVGLREVEDDLWLVTFAGLDLGCYDQRTKELKPVGAKSNELSPMYPV